jgi:hypothetical protein
LIGASGTLSKMADLGRARDVRQAPRLPSAAYAFPRGHIGYAPPELLWGLGEGDGDGLACADLYLLGSLLFELATAQALSAMVFGDPLALCNSLRGLDERARRQDYQARLAEIAQGHTFAYGVFRGEVPSAIRGAALDLLRFLTASDPAARFPRQRFVSPAQAAHAYPWDSDWLLRRIDGIRTALRKADRRTLRRPRP